MAVPEVARGACRRLVGAAWLLSAAAVVVSSPAAAQNLVSNPGFESVQVPFVPGVTYCQASPWVAAGTCGGPPGWPSWAYNFDDWNAHLGLYSLELANPANGGGSATISQQINGLHAGTYRFSFWFDEILTGPGSFTASVGSHSFSIATNLGNIYSQFTQQVTLASGSTTVALATRPEPPGWSASTT